MGGYKTIDEATVAAISAELERYDEESSRRLDALVSGDVLEYRAPEVGRGLFLLMRQYFEFHTQGKPYSTGVRYGSEVL